MKKSKILACVMAFAMACGMLLTGCGNGADSLRMATGGTSGTYYGFSGIVAQVLNEKLSDTLKITVQSTGASKANIQLLELEEVELAIVQNDVMYYAYTATDMFAGEDKVENFSAVISCYPEVVQIIANDSVKSIEDLKGKRVSVGDAGSGVEFNAKQILEAYGITFDDIVVSNQSFADSADSVKNGTIDAAFVVAGTPTNAVTELAMTHNFKLLSVDDAHAKALQDKYGFYATVTVPGGTYTCVTEDVQTVAVMATIVARNDVSEDTIYAFVKGLFDNKPAIAAAHTKGNELDLKTAVSGISIPFHAGAEKYYKEVGALK